MYYNFENDMYDTVFKLQNHIPEVRLLIQAIATVDGNTMEVGRRDDFHDCIDNMGDFLEALLKQLAYVCFIISL